MVSFPVFSVVVCAWLTTLNLRGRLASVGLAQARPNNTQLFIKSKYSIRTVNYCNRTVGHSTGFLLTNILGNIISQCRDATIDVSAYCDTLGSDTVSIHIWVVSIYQIS